MDKKIAIIGAGAAGVLAAMTLLEGGVEGSCITMIDPGADPWSRTQDSLKGFMGAALGNDLILAGEPDMGGTLCNYFSYDDAISHIERTIGKLNSYISNNTQAEPNTLGTNPGTASLLPVCALRQPEKPAGLS